MKNKSKKINFLLSLSILLSYLFFYSGADATSLFWTKLDSEITNFSGRSDYGVTVFKGKTFISGGFDGNEDLNDLLSSSNGKTWTKEIKQSSWSPRSGHEFVSSEEKMFVLGGGNDLGNLKSDVWSSVDGKNWTLENPKASWSSRDNFGSVFFNGKLWIFGGNTDIGHENDIWSSVDGKIWRLESENSAWSPRSGHEVLIFKEKIFLIGGQGEDGRLNDVWVSTDGVTWKKELTQAPWSGLLYLSAVATPDKIYILSAGDRFGMQNNLWSSVDGIDWKQETAFPLWNFRVGYRLLFFVDSLFMVGGYDADDYSSAIYTYRLEPFDLIGETLPDKGDDNVSEGGLNYSYPIIKQLPLPSSVVVDGENILARFVVGASSDGDVVLRKFKLNVETTNISLLNPRVSVFQDEKFSAEDKENLFVSTFPISRSNLNMGRSIVAFGPIVIPAGSEMYFELSARFKDKGDGHAVKTILVSDKQSPEGILSALINLRGDILGNFIWSPFSGGIPKDSDDIWTNSYYSVGLSDTPLEFWLNR